MKNNYPILVTKIVPFVADIQFIIDNFLETLVEFAVYEKEMTPRNHKPLMGYYLCRAINKTDIRFVEEHNEKQEDRKLFAYIYNKTDKWIEGKIIMQTYFEKDEYIIKNRRTKWKIA